MGGIGSAQSAAQGPEAEIVRILAPIFSEQIALVRSTTLDYGAVPSTSLAWEISAFFVGATPCTAYILELNRDLVSS